MFLHFSMLRAHLRFQPMQIAPMWNHSRLAVHYQAFVSGKNSTLGFGTIQDTQLQGVADNIEKQLASGKKIFNLPGEMSFNQISLSPSDIQLLETKTFNVLDICRFFGVHPDKVFCSADCKL